MSSAPTSIVSSDVQQSYDEQYDAATQPWRELGARQKAKNIRDVCQGKTFRRVLDVGAGEGAIHAELQSWPQIEETFALEISRSALEMLRNRNLKTLVEASSFDGYTIPYPDNHFDLSILSHVLEHVEHPRVLLREMARVSRAQVIEVPLDYRFDVDKTYEQLTSYGHINLYTPTLLRFLLKADGFEICRDKLAPLSHEAKRWIAHQKSGVSTPFRPATSLTWRERLSDLRFRHSGRQRQERKAYTYTVLCEKQGSIHIFNDADTPTSEGS